jgi:hypothetical protein
MHRGLFALAALLTLAAILAGCASAPPAVRPTLDGLGRLGFSCGDGMKDNVPSGLFQWSCNGAVDGMASTVLVDGNQEGVVGMTLVIDASADPIVAQSAFAHVVGGVPPLDAAPALAASLAGWTGAQQSHVVGGVRVSAECSPTQCSVIVMPDGDALHPLELP